jgi:phosphopantothenoylcysteine decarboxylase/phosphopantothenate--cysteine ligase
MSSSLRFLVSAGPTREYIDPVRFISNPSSGKMGFAVAEAAVAAGHSCMLVTGPVNLADPKGVTVEHVVSGRDMKKAICDRFDACDILVMTAAVGDYRPVRRAEQKLHKSSPTISLELERNPDIIREVNRICMHQVIIGFAAETENILESATRKMQEKGMDMILANKVGGNEAGFGSAYIAVTALFRSGRVEELGTITKKELAEFIVQEAATLAEQKQAE